MASTVIDIFSDTTASDCDTSMLEAKVPSSGEVDSNPPNIATIPSEYSLDAVAALSSSKNDTVFHLDRIIVEQQLHPGQRRRQRRHIQRAQQPHLWDPFLTYDASQRF